jgi:uncharacterized protein (TIGR02270 family)
MAHLEGLDIAADFGDRALRSELGQGDPGAMFALVVHAMRLGSGKAITELLPLALAAPAYVEAWVEGLAWEEADGARDAVPAVLAELAGHADPARRALVPKVLAAQRRQAPRLLLGALTDPDAGVRREGCRAAATLGASELMALLREVGGVNPGEGEPEAWRALTVLGDMQAVHAWLDWVVSGPDFTRDSIDVAVRFAAADRARAAARRLAQRGAAHAAMVALGALGDPATIDWLIARMSEPKLAVSAGVAFSMITGVDLALLDLDASDDPPDGYDAVGGDETGLQPPAFAPRPDPAAIQQWWRAHRVRFRDGVRYLAGKPITSGSAQAVLVEGTQPQRQAAGLELVRLHHPAVAFPIERRADRQCGSLGLAVAP